MRERRERSESAPCAALVGAGNAGAPAAELHVLQYPERQLNLIDLDHVEVRNLAVQLHAEGDVGRSKSVALAERLGELRPGVRVVPHVTDCRNLGAAFWRDQSITIAAVDNLESEAWLGDMARLVGRPLVRPATSGPSVRGGSASVRWHPAREGACPRCWWGRTARSLAEEHFSCPDLRTVVASGARTTPEQVAHEGFLAAGLAMKVLQAAPATALQVRLAGGATSLSCTATPIERNAACHGRHEPADELLAPPGAVPTLGEAFRLASDALEAPLDEVVLDASLHPLVVEWACLEPECRASGSDVRFLSWPREAERCPECRRADGRLHLKEATGVSLGALGRAADSPLGELRPPTCWAGLFNSREREVLLVPSAPRAPEKTEIRTEQEVS